MPPFCRPARGPRRAKLIYGDKAKNDKIDAGKFARLLRGGNFPLAYVYPKGMRETRDLLRRRTYLVRQRSALFTHLQILNGQFNLPPFPKKLSFADNRAEPNIAERFADPSVQHSAAVDMAVIDALDEQIGALELNLTRTAKVDDVQGARPGGAPRDSRHGAFGSEGQFLSSDPAWRKARCTGR